MADGIRPPRLSRTTAHPAPLTLYHVGRATHPLFDGTGAARFGARWTSPGRPAIYAAGSYAGALLEVLAHARRLDLKVEYHCLVIRIPKTVRVLNINPQRVLGWDDPDYVASRIVGDRWLDGSRGAVLRVPSATARPHEVNYIINPQHPDARKLRRGKPHPVIWDGRLLKP